MGSDVDRECERAIRLAVAETAEACAALCSDAADDFGILRSPEGQQAAAYCANEIRTVIHEKAREKK
jgi:hypothetical protein